MLYFGYKETASNIYNKLSSADSTLVDTKGAYPIQREEDHKR